MPVVDPERVQNILNNFKDSIDAVLETLHVPSFSEVWFAGKEAAFDSSKAASSVTNFVYLVGQPLVRSIAWILYWISLFVYKFILLEGIYNHGLGQAKDMMLWLWKFQSNLTPQQLVLEAIFLVALFGVYQLRKYLKRKKYLYKARLWVDRKKHAVAKTYKEGIRLVAKVSINLAAMASHLVFLGGALILRFFIPGLILAHANPQFISILSFWIPFSLTITGIFEYKERQRRKEEEWTKADARNKTRDKSHTTQENRNNTQSLISWLRAILPSAELLLEDELEDWARFWVVRASVEVLKCLLASFSWVLPRQITSISVEFELVFYVWVYVLPFIQPNSIAGQPLPEGRPLRVVYSFVGPRANQLVEFVSNAVPLQLWQENVVGYASKFLGALVMVRFVSQPTHEWLLHVLEQSRALVVPAISLFMPGFLTSYGVVYVQYILPTSKSYLQEKNMEPVVLWLQYWVLNSFVNGLLFHFRSILWWIPLSTHATFLLWCYLSMPKSIEDGYRLLESELENFGLFPGDKKSSIEKTKSYYMFSWIWNNLPKAKDNEDQNNSPTDAPNMIRDEVPVQEVSVVEGEKDKVSPLSKGRKEHSVSPRIMAIDTNTTIEDDDDDTEYVATSSNEEDEEPRMMTRSARRRAPQSAQVES